MDAVPEKPVELPKQVIRYWPRSRLKPYEQNVREHTPEQISQIAASIRQWGWTMPLLADEDGVLLAGHGRFLAADLMNIDPVPVIIAKGWTEDQKRAYRIADNQLTLNSRWDDVALRAELARLKLADFDLPVIGFEAGQLKGLLLDLSKGETDPRAEWQNMPEFYQGNAMAFRSILVHFKDQAAVDDFQAKLGRTISEKAKFLWLPEQPDASYVANQYKQQQPEPQK